MEDIAFQDKLFLKNYGFDSGNAFLLNISVHDQISKRYPASGIEVFAIFFPQLK